MKHPAFQKRFAAVLTLLALFDFGSAWRGDRARQGLMAGPPGGQGMGQVGGAQSSASQPGLVSNTANVHALKVQAPLAIVPGGTFYMYSQVETLASLAAYTPPVSGMWLSLVHVGGGAAPGGMKWVYASPNTAIFGAPASRDGAVVAIYGNETWVTYPVSYQINGTSIPTTTFAQVGLAFQAILTSQTIPPAGSPDISAYRAVYVTAAPTSATTTSETITFDAQPGVARAILAYGINTVGTATAGDNSAYWSYSAGGSYTQYVPCPSTQSGPQIQPLQPVPAANTYTISLVTVTLTGTTTFTGVGIIFY